MLKRRPLLALEVFSWRRKIATGPDPIPLFSEEYSKAIALAGRARNVDLAVALFYEAITSFPDAALYNALMSAYMFNGMMRRCLAVFQSLKEDRRCKPTIVSYNILLSLFGRSLLVCPFSSFINCCL
jgi:pentatricopeptide repeat protein